MKKFYAFLICFTAFSSSTLFSQNWSWARAGNSLVSSSDQANDVAVDASGNVYITGYFSGPGITFTSPAMSLTLTNSDPGGTAEIFLVKYNAAGDLQWAISGMGDNIDDARALAVDGMGNIYLTGYFQSTSLALGSTTLVNNSSSGNADVFIAKFNPAGNLVWATRHGGSLTEWGMDIAADAAGNAYVTGFFNSLSLTWGMYSVINSGSSDAWMVKLDPNGVGLWVSQIGGSLADMGVSIALDASANVYLAGTFESAQLGFSPNLVNAGGSDIFYAKYNSAGSSIFFSQSIGGPGDEDVWSITSDAVGNFFMTGRYTSNPLQIGSTMLPRIGARDMFTAGFSVAGTSLWAKRANGNNFSNPSAVQADLFGNVYLSGFALNLWPLSFGTTTLSGGNPAGSYIVKMNSLTGLDTWGTTIDANARNMDLDLYGNIHLAGSFGNSVAIGSTTLTGELQTETFVAKMCNLPVITGTGITVCAGLTGSLNVSVPPGFIPKWFNAATGGSLIAGSSSSMTSASSGTFYLELTDTIAGCGFTGPRVALSVSVHPEAYITVSGNSLTANLTATNVTLQWYDCDYGTIVTGANGSSFMPPVFSSYAVIATIGNCTDTSACLRFPPVGIKDLAKQDQRLRIYPNPSNGHLSLTSEKAATMQLINLVGEVVRTIKVEEGTKNIDLTDLPEGLYFLSDGRIVGKVIIRK